jgi:hypothetical protein
MHKPLTALNSLAGLLGRVDGYRKI